MPEKIVDWAWKDIGSPYYCWIGYHYYAHLAPDVTAASPPAEPRSPVRLTDDTDQMDRPSLLIADWNRHRNASMSSPWETSHFDMTTVSAQWTMNGVAQTVYVPRDLALCYIDGHVVRRRIETIDTSVSYSDGYARVFFW